MSERELKRDLAILPISVVRELTGLSDRQIRYYDQQELIAPQRGAGKQRRYSLNDIDRLIEIADIHEMDAKKHRKADPNTDVEMRKAFADELVRIGRFDNSRHF